MFENLPRARKWGGRGFVHAQKEGRNSEVRLHGRRFKIANCIFNIRVYRQGLIKELVSPRLPSKSGHLSVWAEQHRQGQSLFEWMELFFMSGILRASGTWSPRFVASAALSSPFVEIPISLWAETTPQIQTLDHILPQITFYLLNQGAQNLQIFAPGRAWTFAELFIWAKVHVFDYFSPLHCFIDGIWVCLCVFSRLHLPVL